MMSPVPPGGPGVVRTALGFLSIFTLLMTVPS